MADIIRIDLTVVQDSQKALYQLGLELTDYSNGTTITLEASRTVFIGQSPYRVDSGTLLVPDPGGLSNGAVFLYVTEDGDGTATATLSNTVPTYSTIDGGYYDGLSRAVFVFTKSGANFNDRFRMSEVDKDLGVQIGQIIDIHPEVIKKPNAFNFAICNNTVSLPAANFTKVVDSNAPDLNTKYIKGGTAHGLGGANTRNLEHSHSHSHSLTTNGSVAGVANFADFIGNEGGIMRTINTAGGATIGRLTPNTNSAGPNALSSSQSFEPVFFTVLKYMRIN